jgi:hypothetical protein
MTDCRSVATPPSVSDYLVVVMRVRAIISGFLHVVGDIRVIVSDYLVAVMRVRAIISGFLPVVSDIRVIVSGYFVTGMADHRIVTSLRFIAAW